MARVHAARRPSCSYPQGKLRQSVSCCRWKSLMSIGRVNSLLDQHYNIRIHLMSIAILSNTKTHGLELQLQQSMNRRKMNVRILLRFESNQRWRHDKSNNGQSRHQTRLNVQKANRAGVCHSLAMHQSYVTASRCYLMLADGGPNECEGRFLMKNASRQNIQWEVS